MGRLLSLVCGSLLLVSVASADVKQGDVKVILSVPQVISLVIITEEVVVVPGPEDYNRKVGITDPKVTCGGDGDGHLHVYGCLTGKDICEKFKGKGFIDRAEAIKLVIFTNAQHGANLYVHGQQPGSPTAGVLTGVLRLEDTFLCVMTEKTFILANDLEGANAQGPGKNEYKTDPVSGQADFLQMTNEAQKIFGVTQATKAPREVVFKLGIGNLDRYTEGNYSNTLVFTLMPNV